MGDPGRNWIVRQIPNLISGMRLGLAIAFPLISREWLLAAAIIAGLSDLLDGLIARRFQLMSWQGGVLDAIADKAFTLSALLTFAGMGMLEWWHVIVLLARDITVGTIAAYGALRREWDYFAKCPSRLAGKATTLLIFAFILAALAWAPAGEVLLWCAMTASVVAAADYILVLTGWLRERAREKDSQRSNPE